MNEIEYTKKALKQLSKFSVKVAKEIIEAIDTLEKWPDTANIKKLSNHKYSYRLRIGRYRAFFEVEKRINKQSKPVQIVTVIIIEEVKKRDEHTY